MAFAYGIGVDTLIASVANDVGTLTGIQIDTDWTFETAAKEAFFVRFVSPLSQTNAALTLYVYPTAVTGTPTFGIECRNGAAAAGDTDRPEAAGATIGTPGADITPTANRWATFTFSSLSLVAGQTYYLVIKNTTGDPTTNHATWTYRGNYEGQSGWTGIGGFPFLQCGYTQAGFTADPTVSSSLGPAVLKFGDGTIWGFPYVSQTAHASNSNDRGNRVNFLRDTVIIGIATGVTGTAAATIEITKTSDHSVLLSQTIDEAAQLKHGGGMFPAVTLSAGVDYDVVITMGASTTAGARAYMGEADGSLPADVQACRPSWLNGFVGGATDPASYTLTVGLALPMAFFIDAMGTATGGGLLTHPGFGGRLV